MRKLALHHTLPISGVFEPTEINLLFVFQVNCPGCFIHGIPLVNKLAKTFVDKLQILGMATAFEDFDLNTEHNTRKLVHNGEVVGETARYFEKYSTMEVPEINFPVVFDELVAGVDVINEEFVELIGEFNPNFNLWPKPTQKAFRKKVMDYYGSQPIVPKTFTLNQLRGTPSYIFFNQDQEIIAEHFGGLDQVKLFEWLKSKLNMSI